MVDEVCRACDGRGIRNPERQQAYAKRAVSQFDRRLDLLLAKRQSTLH